MVKRLFAYLQALSPGRIVLWCYLIWYLFVLARYFDPNPRLWLTSLGISGVIGLALYLSTVSGANPVRLDRWQVLRLFLMPFCVSSFSALVKGRQFLLVFPPSPAENLAAFAGCGLFVAGVLLVKRLGRVS